METRQEESCSHPKRTQLVQNQQQQKFHRLIHSCYGSRSLVGLLSLAAVLLSWMGLRHQVMLGDPCPKGETKRSCRDRSSPLGWQRCLSPDLKEGAAPRMQTRREGREPATKQRCSSLLPQGYLPGLTHMGIVETPGHEAPLCPVPPRTGGVTTVAPAERGSSSSSCSEPSSFGEDGGNGASLGWLKGSFQHTEYF